eukprot:gene4944-8724_t
MCVDTSHSINSIKCDVNVLTIVPTQKNVGNIATSRSPNRCFVQEFGMVLLGVCSLRKLLFVAAASNKCPFVPRSEVTTNLPQVYMKTFGKP